MSETKVGLKQLDHGWAYTLWEQAGRSDAQQQRFRDPSYATREREGRPKRKADEHWCKARAFEAC